MKSTTESSAGPIAWSKHGSGPPLLLINGYAATGADWAPQLLAGLQGEFTVICPDNRGVGGSALGAGELSVAGMAADLLAVLDALRIECASLCGWSMGGFLVQELAATHPERVSALLLLATDGGGPEALLPEETVSAELFDRSGSPREQASRLIALLFPAGVAAEIDARFGDLVAEARAALAPQTLVAQEQAMAAWHYQPAASRLASIGARTLVMAGECDRVIPAANAALLAAAIDGAELRTYPGAGHGFIAQEAIAVSAAIREFLLRSAALD